MSLMLKLYLFLALTAVGLSQPGGYVAGQNAIGSGMENCVELVRNRLYMYWTLESDQSGNQIADIVLEGRLPDGATENYYLSYGYAKEGARGSEMTGGTAILGGLVNGECFGYDYYLQTILECDYSLGFGACPTYVSNGKNDGTTMVEMVACEKKGNVLAVRMRKPLGVDIDGLPGTAWPADDSRYAMYAMGRVGAGSSIAQPDALLHTVETPQRPGLKLALDQPQTECLASSPLGLVVTDAAAAAASPPPAADVVATPDAIVPPSPVSAVEASPSVLPVDAFDGEAERDDDDDDDDDDDRSEAEGEADHDDDDHDHDDDDDDDDDGEASAVVQQAAADAAKVSMIPLKCVMTINGEQMNFQTCTDVTTVGSNFNIAWNLTMDPNDPGVTIMTMGMNASINNQYVSVGFPSKKNSMVDAAAMILSSTSTIGTSLKQYYMTGYDESDVDISSEGANVLDIVPPFGPENDGMVSGLFTVSLPYSFSSVQSAMQGQRRRRLFQSSASPLSAYNLIFAAGDVRSDGSLKEHYDDGAGDVNLAIALVSDGFSISNDITVVQNEGAKVAHQVLSAIGWGILVPLGVIGARAKNQLQAPKWYNAHRYIMAFGYLLGLVGFGLGFAINKSWDTLYTVHRDLGVTITVLATVQVLALLWKPKPGTTLRKIWGPYHMWVGRCTTLLALANIYYGMFGMGEENVDTWAWAVYSACLALIVILGLVSEYREFLLRKEQALATQSKTMEEGQFKTAPPLDGIKDEKDPGSSGSSMDGVSSP
ncbi:hypothetical protein M9434_005320 [Picochlorum sp. BPE23]|nr:hypothetical protein M9434_005320 [Picochlorum sp. BPE23]